MSNSQESASAPVSATLIKYGIDDEPTLLKAIPLGVQ
jgi:hypothetical protein